MRGMKNILMVLGLMMSISLYAEYPMPYPVDTIDGKTYYRYTVERSIGLYRISKNFGVTQEEILEANPELQQRGLRFEEVILVPAKAVEKEEEKTVNEGENRLMTVNDSGEEKNDNINRVRSNQLHRAVKKSEITISADGEEENKNIIEVEDSVAKEQDTITAEEDTIRLAVMLPLMADAIKRDRNMDRFYDFYAGMLIAIHEVQSRGQKIAVYTYDVGKNADKTIALLNDSTWQKVDAIVGPVYGSQVHAAATFAKQTSTPVLIPFAANVAGIENNPYLYKFNPSDSIVADTLARYLKQYGDSVNCVVFESASSDMVPQSISEVHSALKRHGVPMVRTNLKALLTDSLEGSFAQEKENIVIFNTEKYANLQGVMPHLLNAAKQYPITLFSRYSWQNEKISLPQIYTSVFASEPSVSAAYAATFEQYFGHELSSNQPRYDLLGYDLTLQLLHQLMHTATAEEQTVWYGIQSNILYQALSEISGYENQEILIIRK